MDWKFFSFDSLSDPALDVWQGLNKLHLAQHPGLDGQFMGLLLKYYGDGEELFAIATENGEPAAAAIVKKVGWGIWTLFMPGQGCLSPLIYSTDRDGTQIVNSLQRALPGFCWLLRMPKIDPAFQPMSNVDKNPRFAVSDYGTTFSVSLSGEFDEYWTDRSKSLRYRIRRQFRDLDNSNIRVSMSRRSSSQDVSDGVRIHAEIESSGWKGQHGSAIAVNNRQGVFYRDLLQSFADRNAAHTFQLEFNGDNVASLLCIASGKMMITLKTTYREDFAAFGPGRVIDYLMLQKLIPSSNYDAMEMYTRASRADLSWATGTRVTLDVSAFRYRWTRLLADISRKLRTR